MPSLLYLTQRLPYPPIKGEKIRPLQILKYLARSYDVYVGCLIDDPADAALMARVHDAGRQIAELATRPRVADFIDFALSHGQVAFSIEELEVAELDAMRDVKQVFDPGGLLNPEKILPPRSADEGSQIANRGSRIELQLRDLRSAIFNLRSWC